MTRKFVIFSVAPLAVFFFVVGWFSHNEMIQFVTAEMGQSISVASLQEALSHRLITSISLACLGVVVGFGVLLGGRFSLSHDYRYFFLLLILVAVLAVSGWMIVLARRMTVLGEQLASTSVVSEMSLLLTEIPLYEISLFGSGCVLAIAVVLASVGEKRKSK